MNKEMEQRQRETCVRYGADYCPTREGSKLGIARDVQEPVQPPNGLRHPPVGETCGWYLWRGTEMSQADDYFQPMHVAHLTEECPEALPFLGLPPGWLFLCDNQGYVDVWFDETLLHIK